MKKIFHISIIILSTLFVAQAQKRDVLPINFTSRKVFEFDKRIIFNFDSKLFLQDSIAAFPFFLNLGYNNGKIYGIKWGNSTIYNGKLVILNFMRNPSLPGDREDLIPNPIFYRFNCMDIEEINIKSNKEEHIRGSNKVISIKPTWDQSKLLHYDFVEALEKLFIILKTDKNILIYSAKDSNNVCANEWEKEMEFQHNFTSEYFVAYKKDSKNILLDFETLGQVEINIKKRKLKINSTVQPNLTTNHFYFFKDYNKIEKINEKKLLEITRISAVRK